MKIKKTLTLHYSCFVCSKHWSSRVWCHFHLEEYLEYDICIYYLISLLIYSFLVFTYFLRNSFFDTIKKSLYNTFSNYINCMYYFILDIFYLLFDTVIDCVLWSDRYLLNIYFKIKKGMTLMKTLPDKVKTYM